MSFILSAGVIIPPLTAGAVAYGNGAQAFMNSQGTSGQVLTSAGAAIPTWSTVSGIAVTSFSAGSTGLTPSSPTAGAVSLAGTLAAGYGGTGLTAPGSSGNVLTSNGTGWVSSPVAAGAMTLIGTFTQVNGATTLNAASVFSASYKNYIVFITNIIFDSDCDLYFRGWDGTTDYGAYNTVQARNGVAVGAQYYGGLRLNYEAGVITATSTNPFCATIFLNTPTVTRNGGTYNTSYRDNPNDHTTLNGSFDNMPAITGFRLEPQGGAAYSGTTGKVYVYGLT